MNRAEGHHEPTAATEPAPPGRGVGAQAASSSPARRAARLRWQRLWEIVGLVGLTAVIVASLVPLPQAPGGVPFADKLQHIGVYAALMLWFGCIYQGWPARAAIGAGLLLIGGGLELAHWQLPYRDFELLDIAANSAGVAGGLVLAATPLAGALAWVEAWVEARLTPRR